jgi:signal transduction histidine kinase/ActR/RegA family two-component response regulator
LLARLLVIVVLAMLPAILVLVSFQHELQINRRVQARTVALRQAEILNTSLGAIVEGARQLMTTITHFERVNRFDPACTAVLQGVTKDLPSYAFLAVANAQGVAVCISTRTTMPPGVVEAMAANAMAEPGFAIGQYRAASPGYPAFLSFGLPFTAEPSGSKGVVLAGLSLEWLGQFVASIRRPADAIFSIVDRNGIVLAREPDPQIWVGRHVVPDVVPLLNQAQAGTAIVPSFEGKRRIVGFVPSTIEPVGLYVSAGFLLDELTADIDAAAWRGYLMIGVAACLSVLLALIVGQRFVQAPTAMLLRAAEDLGSGDLTVRAKLPKGSAREFHNIGAAFNAMAATLEQQRSELQSLNDALETRVEERTRALLESNDRLQVEIAERAAAEDRLRQAQKLQAVGQLAGGIAHDFNNLLTAVMGSLELMRRRIAPGDAHLLRLVDMAGLAVERGTRLTSKLLGFSRNQPLLSVPIDVAAALEGMAALLSSTLGAAIWLETKLSPGLWIVAIDPNQFETAILNLALNARDAMPSGGRLLITAINRTIPPSEATLDLPAGDYVSVTVADSGMGMSEETLARAFEPFFTTRALGEGAGLGLSQVHGLVRQSGGDVRINSRAGAGTRVTMLLPRTFQEPVQYASNAPVVKSPAPADDRTILLVDDDDDVRDVMASLLTDGGYGVVQAADGEAALACLADTDQSIRFVIADYAMPGMSGRELLMRVRGIRPDLPVLLVTGYADFTALSGDELLADQIVRKPFRGNELLARIRLVWDRELSPSAE